MILWPTWRCALFSGKGSCLKKMVKTHFLHEFHACYWACSLSCNEMRYIKLASYPEKPAHWKYESKLAYEILNWRKLKKTWKDMKILSQFGLFVISKASKRFVDYLPGNISSCQCTILLELTVTQKAKLAIRNAGSIMVGE